VVRFLFVWFFILHHITEYNLKKERGKKCAEWLTTLQIAHISQKSELLKPPYRKSRREPFPEGRKTTGVMQENVI
jgi:hypothetical protein